MATPSEKVREIRAAMPATTAHVYLNTGTFGSLPECVPQAIEERVREDWRQGRLGAFETMFAIYTEARSRVAQLLHAEASEVALTDNTGEGMNVISYGFDWKSGDEVITTNHEHISALAPLYQIRDRFGVKIAVADLGPRAEESAAQAITALITPRTRLISLSHVTWTTGAVLDIAEVVRVAHEHDIPVLVDGAQSAGNIPIDVKALGVDFYAIPMQKWLCGPDGTGGLYIRQEAMRHITPTYVGYFSILHEEDFVWKFQETAQRFELGGRQTAAIAGQNAVLEWLDRVVGHEWLFPRIAMLNRYAASVLHDIAGLTLLTSQAGSNGLLAFTLKDANVTEVVQWLRTEHNIFTRSIPESGALRISTGFYNTEEEIDLLAEALRKWRAAL